MIPVPPAAAALRARAGQLEAEIRAHEDAVAVSRRTGIPAKPGRPVQVLRILADEFRAVADMADPQGENAGEREP